MSAQLSTDASMWRTLEKPELRQRLLAIALRYGASDNADAEDCVQEALATAFVKRASLEDPRAIDAWLAQIVLNASRMRARSRRRLRRGGLSVHVELEESMMPLDEAAEQKVIRLEVLAEVESLIANDRDGDLMHACLTWPGTLEELAERRGMKHAVLRTRLRRVRERLRAAVEQA